MKELTTSIDLVELGQRFKLVRQKLGISQKRLGEQINTTQLMIYRIEKGIRTQYGVILALMMFISNYASVSIFFTEEFDIDSIKLVNKRGAHAIFNTTLKMLQNDVDRQLDALNKTVKRKMDILYVAVNKLSSSKYTQVWQIAYIVLVICSQETTQPPYGVYGEGAIKSSLGHVCN